MSEPESPKGTFQNRDHYLKAALIGGTAAALLSITPIINWLNFFFFALVIAGGAVSAYWVQKRTGTVEPLEGSVIGALSGIVCGLVLFALGMCMSTGFALLIMPEMSDRESREFSMMLAMLLSGSCCMSLTIYPLFAALGGLITPLIWPPTQGPAGAPKAEPTPEQLLRRKKVMRITLGSLGGCLGLLLLFCVVSGYLAYLQSRGPEDTAGEDAVVEAPVVLGERITLTIPPSGQTSTQYGIWLVADEALPSSMYDLQGEIGCRESYGYYGEDSDPYLSSIYSYYSEDDGEPAWHHLRSEYVFSSEGSRCVVVINQLPAGVTGARIVVTRLHEPSDWLK